MVTIKMLNTKPGSPDGIAVHTYEKGKVYPQPGKPVSESLARSFLSTKDCELVKPAGAKSAGAAPENKAAEAETEKPAKPLTAASETTSGPKPKTGGSRRTTTGTRRRTTRRSSAKKS